MVLAISVVAWILAILAGSMQEFITNRKFYGMTLVAVFFFVPFMVILGAYGKIAQVARAHGRGNLTFRKVNITLYCYNPGQKSLDSSTKILANHSARIYPTHALLFSLLPRKGGGGEVGGPEGVLKTVNITLPNLFLIYI